jgi:hypothetical protein
MQPYRSGLCRDWCDDTIAIYLVAGEASQMYRNVWQVRRIVAGEVAAFHGVRYTRTTPPQGYTEAWQEKTRSPKPASSFETSIFIHADDAGTPTEYVRCTVRLNGAGRRLCIIQTTLDDAPSVQVDIAFVAETWPAHAEIREAVMRLVGSWRR